MPTPYLIADAAQVTVLRSLASTAFGRYDLKPPKGVDVEELYPPSAPGNEAAYVASLDPKRRVGGMFRRFIRADVKIQAPDGEEAVATSNVEEVLDGVADRTSGDFFLESDISQAGLGPWVPFTDFNVGDLVNVEIWGRVVRLPVVRINPKDWSVHVGGQLLSDADARLAQNADIYNAVVNDRRELAGLDGKIRTETKNRKAAISAEAARSNKYADELASSLTGDFEESYKRYSEKLTNLGDEWRRELKNGLNAEQQARVEALRAEQVAREKAGTDLRGQLEKQINEASANASSQIADEARARQRAINDLSRSFTTDLETYGKLVKEAKEYVDPATAAVVAFWSEENQNNFNKAVQLTLAAQSAYNDVNNIKWVSQDAWNNQQQKINDATAKFQAQQREINAYQKKLDAAQNAVAQANTKATNANAKALAVEKEYRRRLPRLVFAKFPEYKNTYIDPERFLKIEPYDSGDRGFRITALGTWTGSMVVRATAAGTLSANSIDSTRVYVTRTERIFNGVPYAVQMAYTTLDITIYPD